MEKLNINTAEGWSKYAEITNRKSFVHTFGREPIDTAEVTAWVNAAVAKTNDLYPISDKEPEQTLRTFDGKLYWVTKFK